MVAMAMRRTGALFGAGAGVLVAGAVAQRVVDRSVASLPTRGRFVQVDDAPVHVVDGGDPEGTVVVAETGLGGTAADWDRVTRRLPEGIRLIAVDRPGLGRSAIGAPPDVDGTARRLVAVLGELGVAPPVVLAGWSLGGLLDVGVALSHPQLVAGLVLVDPSHPDEARRFDDAALHPVGRALLHGVALGSRLGGAALAGIPSRIAYVRATTNDGVEPVWQVPTYATATSGRALAAELLAFPAACDEVGALRPLARDAAPDVPVELLCATRRADVAEARAWDEMHADLAGWFPRTEVHTVPGSGHTMLADRPDEVAAAIGRVVRSAVPFRP